MNTEEDKALKNMATTKLTLTILGGFAIFFLLAFACYYFNIELTDLT
jgi:hypothetical protein